MAIRRSDSCRPEAWDVEYNECFRNYAGREALSQVSADVSSGVYYTWQITLCELSFVNLKDLMFFVLVNVLRIWACIKITSQVQSSFIVLVQHGVTQPDSVVIPLYYTRKTREKPMHSCREGNVWSFRRKVNGRNKNTFWADNMSIFKVGWVLWFRNIFSCFNYLHIPKAII